jgi:hypothetical protein
MLQIGEFPAFLISLNCPFFPTARLNKILRDIFEIKTQKGIKENILVSSLSRSTIRLCSVKYSGYVSGFWQYNIFVAVDGNWRLHHPQSRHVADQSAVSWDIWDDRQDWSWLRRDVPLGAHLVLDPLLVSLSCSHDRSRRTALCRREDLGRRVE